MIKEVGKEKDMIYDHLGYLKYEGKFLNGEDMKKEKYIIKKVV